jgi:sugar lactone lactonase YvrE
MRSIAFSSAFLLAGLNLFGQQYNINTVAGGSPLPNASAAVNAPIGNPTVLTSDPGGNIYFVSDDCVFEINTSGAMARVAGNSRVGYSGDGGAATAAQLNGPQGLAVDSSGNLYIADTGNNRVRKVTAGTGVITTIAGIAGTGYSATPQPASSAALNGPQGLAVDAAGDLYIADTGNNVIREIVASTGVISTVAGNGTAGTSGDGLPATSAQLNVPTGVALDSSNNIYIADSKNNRIREVQSGIMSTIAGNGLAGFSGDNNLATAAELNSPTGVAVAPNGIIYVLDTSNNRVREIMPNKVISTIGGVGGTIPSNSPAGIATDPSSDVFVADGSHVIFKDSVAGAITVFAGNGAVSYALGDSGPATSAQLVQPEGLAVDTSNNVYVADVGEARIRRFLQGGNISSPAGATAIAPAGVAVDSLLNIYIADAKGNVVFKVSSAGVSTTIAGIAGVAGAGGDNGLATSAQLNQPSGVAVDSSGNVYIADTGNNKIRKITVVTGVITTIAGNGSAGFQGDGSVSINSELNQPSGVAVDSTGDVFIADTGNNRIREIAASSGIITTVAGNGTQTSSGDGGLANAAGIVSPHGVAVDVHGNLYIPDNSGRVRKVSVSGLITTIAGNGTPGYSGDGGAATSAQLDTPWGVAVDSGGNVYVSDPGEQAVRILTPVAAAPLSILTTSPLPAGTAGTPYAQALAATGGTPPYSWSIAVGSLPAGLTLSSQGSISGTPTSAGTFLITFQVTDSASITAQSTIEIVINSSAPTGLAITTSPVLVAGGVGLPYSQTLTAQAGNPPYTFALISGALPAGLGLSPAGVISGTPVAAGAFTFTIRVNDSTNAIASQTFTLQVYSFATPTRSGVLAHYAAGGPWSTRAYLTNVANAPVEVNLVVHTDDGSILPFTLTQQGATQQVGGNLFVGVMNPNTTIVINAGTGLANTETGWIDVLTSGATNPLAGFAVFHLSSNGTTSEGTTPLQTTFASSMHLQFDDTAGYNTDVAVANLSTNAATVTATVFDQNGNTLGTYSLSLGAQGHTSFVIPSQFGVTNNQIGLIQFTNTSGGTLGGVGLRASTVTGTFTTVPVIVP